MIYNPPKKLPPIHRSLIEEIKPMTDETPILMIYVLDQIQKQDLSEIIYDLYFKVVSI